MSNRQISDVSLVILSELFIHKFSSQGVTGITGILQLRILSTWRNTSCLCEVKREQYIYDPSIKTVGSTSFGYEDLKCHILKEPHSMENTAPWFSILKESFSKNHILQLSFPAAWQVINHKSCKKSRPRFDTKCQRNSGRGTKHGAGLCLRLFYGPVSQVSLSEQNGGFAGCNWQPRTKVRYWMATCCHDRNHVGLTCWEQFNRRSRRALGEGLRGFMSIPLEA